MSSSMCVYLGDKEGMRLLGGFIISTTAITVKTIVINTPMKYRLG